MTDSTWAQLADALDKNLHLTSPPLAITFSAEPPAGVEPFDAPMPDPMPDGRTGRVPAGCVFWMHAAARTFSTVADDHANCSVGSMTHGFKTLDEVAGLAAIRHCGTAIDLDVGRAVAAVRQMRERFRKPDMTAGDLLLFMEARGLTLSVDMLRDHVTSL